MTSLENTAAFFPKTADLTAIFYYGVHAEHCGYQKLYTFRFLAPSAEAVFLVSGFLSWEIGKKMTRLDHGVWEVTVATDRSLEGECYKYKVIEKNTAKYLSDPFAMREEGFGGHASVIATEIPSAKHYPAWQATCEKSSPLHLLEVSLASFYTRGNRLPFEEGAACRYKELAEKLVIYAKSTGYTHVKLLPREKEAHHSYFAPSPRYGTPEEFSAFVNILHENGVGLIYTFHDPETDYDASLVFSACDYFLSHYAVDGIAFEENGKPTCDNFKDCLALLQKSYPEKLFFADTAFDGVSRRSEAREEIFASFLTLPYDKRRYRVKELLDAITENGTLASQSRELTRGGRRSTMESFFGSYEQKFAENRLYQMLLTVSKGDKLSFMMQSLAPFRPWQDHLLPEWYMADFKLHRAHRRFIKALNRLYLETPLLYTQNRTITATHLDFDRGIVLLSLCDECDKLLFAFNFSDTLVRDYPLPVSDKAYIERFSSDEESFAGEGYVHRMTLWAREGKLTLDLAPLSAVLLQPIETNN